MKGQIYQAFVNAGFGREANLLSTTIDGEVVPALGHYIAILDNKPVERSDLELLKLNKAYDVLIDFLYEHKGRITDEQLKEEVKKARAEVVIDHNTDAPLLDRFVAHYTTSKEK